MRKLNLVMMIILGLALTQCSTYSIKSDMAKNGIVKETPKWYVDYSKTTFFSYQETASAVSPDMELGVKKAVLLAKAKMADRIAGEMNNRTTITKNEGGRNENLGLESQAQDAVVNVIANTILDDYKVSQQEIYATVNNSYRVYVMIEVSKKNIEAVKARAILKLQEQGKIDVEKIEKTQKSVLKKS